MKDKFLREEAGKLGKSIAENLSGELQLADLLHQRATKRETERSPITGKCEPIPGFTVVEIG